MRISAGALDQRATIQARADATDVLGQPTGAWEDVDTVWASVKPLRSRERFAAGQAQSNADTRIVIRYRDDVTAKNRIAVGGKTFEIVGEPIDVDFGHHTLELMCSTAP